MGIKSVIRKVIKNNISLAVFTTYVYNHMPFSNNLRVSKNNYFEYRLSFLKKTKLNIKGKNNRILVFPDSHLKNCRIYIFGNNNNVTIGGHCNLNNLEIWIEDDGNEILIGEYTSVSGQTQIACIEGCKISIGKDSMLSSNIYLRTGDSHSIIDMQGNRVNQSKNISIGEHVWIGQSVIVTKGVKVPSNSIIGAGSVVTKSFEESNVVLAGNPAFVRKRNVCWKRERI